MAIGSYLAAKYSDEGNHLNLFFARGPLIDHICVFKNIFPPKLDENNFITDALPGEPFFASDMVAFFALILGFLAI